MPDDRISPVSLEQFLQRHTREAGTGGHELKVDGDRSRAGIQLSASAKRDLLAVNNPRELIAALDPTSRTALAAALVPPRAASGAQLPEVSGQLTFELDIDYSGGFPTVGDGDFFDWAGLKDKVHLAADKHGLRIAFDAPGELVAIRDIKALYVLPNGRVASAKQAEGESSDTALVPDSVTDGRLRGVTLAILDACIAQTLAGTSAGEETDAKNAAALILLRNRVEQQPADRQFNDDVLFVGMNPPAIDSAGSAHEIKHLRRTGARVDALLPTPHGQDKIRVGGRLYDLTTDKGRDGFADTLDLQSQEQRLAVTEGLRLIERKARDELAQIIQVLARGQRGERIPSRLVMSGHHVGSGIWGDGNGTLEWEYLAPVVKSFPEGAAQIEDLHIAACYSASKVMKKLFISMFPNLKTIWAYAGSAPGPGSGATVHQAEWERVTRGRNADVEQAALDLQARNIRKAENIGGYNLVKNSAIQEGSSADELRTRLQEGDMLFASRFTGDAEVRDRQGGPLRQYYSDVQSLLGRTDLTANERERLTVRRDQTIRTIFYTSHIGRRFAEEHRDTIRDGYRALEMTPPGFAALSRADALVSIARFRERLQSSSDPSEAAQALLPLLNGLWNLDPETIPDNWI